MSKRTASPIRIMIGHFGFVHVPMLMSPPEIKQWPDGRPRRACPCPRPHGSKRIGRNLRPRRNPLPLAELIGVTHRAMTEAVSGGTHAADGAIDPVHHRLIVHVDDAGVKSVGDALGAREIG